eukprot:950073-Amphidinium_carterae.1
MRSWTKRAKTKNIRQRKRQNQKKAPAAGSDQDDEVHDRTAPPESTANSRNNMAALQQVGTEKFPQAPRGGLAE